VLLNYAKAFFYYLSVNRYNENYDWWNRFQEEGGKIKKLIDSLSDISLFEIYAKHPGDIFTHYILKIGPRERYKPLLGLEKDLAIMNGVQLLKSLEGLLVLMDSELEGLKDEFLYAAPEDFELVYDLNYVFYADNFWNKKHFRNHTARELMNNVTPERLEDYYRHEIRTFKDNEIGEVWENYSDDRGKMAYELNRKKIIESQWEFFFKHIFRLEELVRWIQELKTPKKPIAGLRRFVVKQEIADAVVEKITNYVNVETKPKPIVRPIRAAMDSGVMHRPSWDAFVEDYGSNKISSKASFNDYTNPEKKHYIDAAYGALVDEFKKFLE
jgi:hypothetical protein